MTKSPDQPKEGLGNGKAAVKAYHQASALLHELNQDFLIPEALAGLARLSLELGDLTDAQAYIETLPSQLDKDNLAGPLEPFLIALSCYRVLLISGDSRAKSVLHTAHRMLYGQAEEISDESLRRAFLEDIPVNRELDLIFSRDDR